MGEISQRIVPLQRLVTDFGLGSGPKLAGHVTGAHDRRVGYCQALFEQESEPGAHTTKVMSLLAAVGLPHHQSHELVAAHQNGFVVSEFLARAMQPLVGQKEAGVPVFITGHDAAKDASKIAEIMAAPVPIHPDDTILVRMIMKNEAGVAAGKALIDRLVVECRATGRRPIWWPLIQGQLTPGEWRKFTDQLGENQKYVALAVNPWTFVPPEFAPQVVVAQVPVGSADGVNSDGQINLGQVKVTGAPPNASYQLGDYVASVKDRDPTYIILGPTPGWGDSENIARVGKAVNLLQRGGVV